LYYKTSNFQNNLLWQIALSESRQKAGILYSFPRFPSLSLKERTEKEKRVAKKAGVAQAVHHHAMLM
jgi:hypothetical protein